jgi:hypothetical protein
LPARAIGPAFMLEQTALLLRPWRSDGVRPVCESDGARAVGVVRRADGGWFARPVLVVVEGEDESLLCTAVGGWWWRGRWRVHDADGHVVGQVRHERGGRIALRDSVGSAVAASESGGAFRTPGGLQLARLERAGEGERLTFTPGPSCDPFARMLVLVAALTATAQPGERGWPVPPAG